MGDRIGVVDRISELPDFIIHHIMSYLSSGEVAQMSALSKRWNYLWISFPILVFNRWKMKSSRERTDEFIRFVDASILRFCELQVRLQKFRVCMTVHDVERVTSLLDKWIELAVALEVKELDFNVKTDSDGDVEMDGDGGDGDGDGNGNGDSMYSLPESIFSTKFFTTLNLRNCNLEQFSGTIRFQSLKKLLLDKVCIDEQMVQNFIRGCPLLEDLFLSPIRHSDSVCVSPAPKLKILTIDSSSSLSDVDVIEIVSPSLQQCTIISDLSDCVIDMAGCYDLKYLNLTDAEISDEDFHNLILKFPLLEKLILCDCTVGRIAFSNNRLRELKVLYCESLISIDVDAPSLLTFSYECISSPASINIPRTCSWKAHFQFVVNVDTLIWFNSIKELLEVPFEIEELSISICVEWFYKKMTNRDAECCNRHGIKCWQYYLRDFKIESFIPFEDPKPHHIDNLITVLPELRAGTIRFHLDWCFS
ncbi:hypothetical protein LWI29_009769 [Acer saccharum]|uniref:F-box domain-containing protein n=1 Tax=Acer saccharum TaxID=4024 RepID=A0AA39RUP7_ACESA|nr:hypothetical protein LWI29_009769 [Acer saccharum]